MLCISGRFSFEQKKSAEVCIAQRRYVCIPAFTSSYEIDVTVIEAVLKPQKACVMIPGWDMKGILCLRCVSKLWTCYSRWYEVY